MKSQCGNYKTKRSVEQKQIENYTVNFIKKLIGKGPSCIKVKILEDIIEICIEDVLTDIEKSLIKCYENISLLHNIHDALIAQYRTTYIDEVSKIVNSEVECIHMVREFENDKFRLILIIK